MAANNALLLDRFVSASSADDAQSSLEQILEALQNNKRRDGDDDKDAKPALAPEVIWSDPAMLDALRHVVHTGKHKQHDMEVPVDEGASLVCKIYMEMVDQESSRSPLLEKDKALLECLIDVISSNDAFKQLGEDEDAQPVSMYTRVLALQLLTKLCLKRPSKAQAQLLQAPNGLHRLGDLLQVNQEEIIRNEALLLAQVIAEWPSCAKIWMFAEVADQVILLAVQEGGLTGGNVLVQDCLDLLFKLLKHDPTLADLVFQSQTITQYLPQLLDLRQGTAFLNPPTQHKVTLKDDDLDEILKSAADKDGKAKNDAVIVPRLTAAEENVIAKTLDILALLLDSDGLKKSVWKRELQLCSFTWELALVAPPPPNMPFACAVPSPQLQQKALETTALYFHDPITLERHHGLDRLLYLVCTGGFGNSLKERMGISQAALHVIRQTVSKATANQMLMYTLAPPMTMDDDENEPYSQPPPTVVHKLLNTVAENLTANHGIDPERRKVFLAGALGGLSLFFTDQTSREVMLRITTRTIDSGEEDPDDPANTTTESLVESLLHAVGDMEEVESPENAFVCVTLLRFLCDWAIETPAVVQTILSSNQSSIVLSVLLGKTKTQSNKRGVAALGKLLLGISMEYMGEDEEQYGGWTRASMMELIAKKSGGVSKFTSSLEQFKSVHDFGDSMPWSSCNLEFKVWSQWFSNCVLLVRKRVVQELTGSADGEEEETDDEGLGLKGLAVGGGDSARSLQKVVHQQSKEIDELQQSLGRANATIKTQQHELSEYKRRVESAPSQLDSMLNEYLARIAELESTVAHLGESKISNEEKHATELKLRDEKIARLEKELEESLAREKEARDEAESVREDMESLSAAYTNLEQEYRRQGERQMQESGVSSTEVHTSQQHAGEQDHEASQLQGAQFQQNPTVGSTGSTEILALRAENERLREDAQAADQWMSMAVTKMNEMGQQNAALKAKLSTLKHDHSRGMNREYQSLQQQYQVLSAEKEALDLRQSEIQANLNQSLQENLGLHGALQQEREKQQELEKRLEETRMELEATSKALGEEREQATSLRLHLDAQLASLVSQLEMVNAEKSRLQEQLIVHQPGNAEQETPSQAASAAVTNYEAALAEKDAEVQALQNALANQSADSAIERQNHSYALESLKISMSELQSQIVASRSEVESTLAHGQEEIYKRESRIRELEAKLSNAFGAQNEGLAETIREKDIEIRELQAANEAAQDWMAKAVDHHNMLAQQHAQLGVEKATLLSQVTQLQMTLAQKDAAAEKAKAVIEQSLVQENRIRDAESALEEANIELERLQSELASLQAHNKELSILTHEVETLRVQVENLKAALAEKIGTCDELRLELANEKASQEAIIARLSDELEQLRSTSHNAEEVNEKVVELSLQLRRAKEEISNLVRSRDEYQKSITRLNKEISSLSAMQRTTHSTASNKIFSTPPAPSSSQPANARDFFSVPAAAPSSSQSADAQSIFSAPSWADSARPTLPAAATASPSQAIESEPSTTAGVEEKSAHIKKNKNEVITATPSAAETVSHNLFATELAERTEQVSRLQEQLRETQQELDKTQKGYSGHNAQGRVMELEDTVESLQKQLREKEDLQAMQKLMIESLEGEKAEHSVLNEAVASQDASSVPIDDVRKELEKTRAALADALAKLEDDDHVVVKWEERVAGLESAVKDLEVQLTEQEENANTVIAKWQESCNSLEEKNAQLLSALESCGVGEEGVIGQEALVALQERLRVIEGELARAREDMKEDDDAVLRWQERVAQLEAAGEEFAAQLSQQESEANAVIASWQQSCAGLEAQNKELARKLEASAKTQSKLQEELGETQQALVNAKARLSEDEEVVVKWQDRVSELEVALSDVECQLTEQEAQTNSVILTWQKSCTTLEEQVRDLTQKLEDARETEQVLQRHLKETQHALDEAREEARCGEEALEASQKRVVEVEAKVTGLQEELARSSEEAKTTTANLMDSCTALEKIKAELSAKLEASEAHVTALQAQLQHQQEALESAKDHLREGEDIVAKWQERASELEAIVGDLEGQLIEQENNANDVISEWQATFAALDEEKTKLAQTAEESEVLAKSLSEQLQETRLLLDETTKNALSEKEALELQKLELAHKLETSHESKNAQLQETIKTLDDVTETLKYEEVVVVQWQERVAGLEALVNELEAQQEQASNAIAMWQDRCAALEVANAELVASMGSKVERERATQESIATLQQQINASTNAEKRLQMVEEDNAKLQERLRELEAALEESEGKTRNIIFEWQEKVFVLEATRDELSEALAKASCNESAMGRYHASVNTQVAETESALAAAQASLKEKDANIQLLEEQLLRGEQETAGDARQELDALRAEVLLLQSKLTEQEISLNAATDALVHDEHAVSAWEKRASELEATVQELQDQLTEQENDAINAIQEWSDRCAVIDKEKGELEQLLRVSRDMDSKQVSDTSDPMSASLSQLTGSLSALGQEKAETKDLKEQVAELESMVNSLQQQLLLNEKEASMKRVQLQESLNRNETQTQEVSRALQEAQANVKELEAMLASSSSATTSCPTHTEDMEDVSLNHDDRQKTAQTLAKDAGLESLVQELEAQMAAKDKEMAGAVLEWQRHCAALENLNNELSTQLEKRDSKSFAETRSHSEGSPEEHIAELESTIEALERDLEESRKEADDAIAEWQGSYNLMQSKNGELESQVATLTSELQALKATKQTMDDDLLRYMALKAEAREPVSKLNDKLEAAGFDESSNVGMLKEIEGLKLKLTAMESALAERECEMSDRPTKSSFQELERAVSAKDEELEWWKSHLESVRKERDEAVARQESLEEQFIENELNKSECANNELNGVRQLTEKVETLESRVEELRNERDSSTAALEHMKESSRSLVRESEDAKLTFEKMVNQWTERSKQLEAVVSELEEQMEQQMTEANEAIASGESRCSELQEGLSSCQSELEGAKAKIIDVLRTQVFSLEKLLGTYDDSYESNGHEDLTAGSDAEALRARSREHLFLVEQLVAKQDGDISSLFIEMESLRTQIQEMDGELQAGTSFEFVRTQLEDLRKQMSEKQRAMDELKRSLANEEGFASRLKLDCHVLGKKVDDLEATVKDEQEARVGLQCELDAKVTELEALANAKAAMHGELEAKDEQLADAALETKAKISELKSMLEDERLARVALQGALDANAADLESTLKDERLAKLALQNDAEALSLKIKELDLKLDHANAQLDNITRRESQVSLELEKSLTEARQLRESQMTKTSEAPVKEATQKELEVLRDEKSALLNELQRLSKLIAELEYDLQEANASMQVYITKEVSDRATSMAAHALRYQLHEIRKQAEADRAAFVAEKEARTTLEQEVQRLRGHLHALVDVTDQENEMYGDHALTIKVTDKIHRKERHEISELRKSLTRALEELRKSRTAERDAEERAAKAAHHVVVCEQELVAAKSDMKYLIMTMDEMRQDEASRRASMEHRIHSLENDHAILQRFHATETDSLRNALTQAVMEKDRTLQLLKDSEKNNAAMLYAASRDHTGSSESPETELAKLRIEKAQLLIAAAEEGARTERRIREVLSTELSSAETDILVEREKRLAADAAVENMKLLVVELQSDLRTFREETRLGRTPTKMQMEQETIKLQQAIDTLAEENTSLRSQLMAAQSQIQNCQYQIEKLTAECRMAQSSSNRLDREIRFQTEVQAEMFRMRSSSQARAPPEADEEKERKEDDVMTIAGLYDKIHEQAEAMRKARDIHQALQLEHEDLLSLLAQTEEKRHFLERALADARGQEVVDEVLRQGDESVIAQYGHRVKVL